MAIGKARSPTPAEVARFGHIAAAVRALMETRKWKPGDLNEALGVKRENTAIYQVLNCRQAPGKAKAAKLAKLMGVAPQALRPRDGAEPVATSEPVRTVVATSRVPEVLSFQVLADGTARLRFDVVLPIEPAKSLLRILLDAEALMKGEDHAV